MIDEKAILFNTMLRHAQKEKNDTLADVYESSFTGVLLVDVCITPEDASKKHTPAGRKTAHRLNVAVQNKRFSSVEELRKWCSSSAYSNAFKGQLHKRLVYNFVANKGCCLLLDDCC